MKRIHRFGLLFLTMIFVSMEFVGIWCVDIGVSGIRIQREVTSGYWDRDAIQQYHIGLYLIAISTLLLASLVIFAVLWKED